MKHLLVMTLLVFGLIPYASAAQLDAVILSGEDSAEPSFQFLRVIYIEYPDDGIISDSLRGKKQTVSFTADSDTLGMNKLVEQINQNLQTIPSNTVVAGGKITYKAILQGNENHAVIEYKIQLIPTITNHVLTKTSDQSIVDASWRGISLDDPILIQTEYGLFDINNPKSALDVMIPDISEKLQDVTILELPLINASGILELPLYKWHSLFDNTAILPSVVDYDGKYVITHYSMGECSIGVGLCNDREWIEDIDLDERYSIRIIESRDDATILIEGYVDTTRIHGIEVFQTNLNSTISQKPDTDEFPATVMYGMAGFAVIGAVVMFVFSNRKLKRDNDESQTGIDPAYLRAYETSHSSGGYKTNRGESHLISNLESKMAI